MTVSTIDKTWGLSSLHVQKAEVTEYFSSSWLIGATRRRLRMFGFLTLPPFLLPGLILGGNNQLMHFDSKAAWFLSHE
ncbi:hypothetical protein BofuT4_uP136750.1 [Botrytis cinerea T4]|uniref:Uncharacterized protein n=1 Tax=Botryotinia fuckeliana (strain T4) TaxID=999810 RepID=G2YPT2_BOTF4|nr:hypothetical protein BofuT4_uP136750.1 [Botrytis cinerea T4]